MTTNPLSRAVDTGAGSRRSLADMLDWCDRENERPLWRRRSRWWFVAPADRDHDHARIDYIEEWKADHARMAAEGKPFVAFDPEPGEAEWIQRAIAQYLKSYPNETKEHFEALMAKWSAQAPWRREPVV